MVLKVSLMLALIFALSCKDKYSCPTFVHKPTVDTFTLSGGTFDLDVKVIITKDTAEALRLIKEIYADAVSSELDARATTYSSNKGQPVVLWIYDRKDRAVVLHEFFHVVKSIMDWAGVPLNDDTQEAYAYELQYIYHQYDTLTNY